MADDPIVVEGLAELRRKLRQLSDGMTDLKDEVYLPATRIVIKRASQLVPVRTGRLRSTLRSSAQAKTGVVRAGNARAPYAPMIHFGNKYTFRPRPYMSDAVKDKEREIVKVYEDGIDKLIKRYGL